MACSKSAQPHRLADIAANPVVKQKYTALGQTAFADVGQRPVEQTENSIRRWQKSFHLRATAPVLDPTNGLVDQEP